MKSQVAMNINGSAHFKNDNYEKKRILYNYSCGINETNIRKLNNEQTKYISTNITCTRVCVNFSFLVQFSLAFGTAVIILF